MLKPYQAKALRQLSPDGFRVGGTRGITTRPDCGISEAGQKALAEYDAALRERGDNHG